MLEEIEEIEEKEFLEEIDKKEEIEFLEEIGKGDSGNKSHLEIKMKAVKAYSTQFFDPDSKESDTPISSKNFIESVSYRARNFGRLIGVDAGEGFTSRSLLSTSNLFHLVQLQDLFVF